MYPMVMHFCCWPGPQPVGFLVQLGISCLCKIGNTHATFVGFLDVIMWENWGELDGLVYILAMEINGSVGELLIQGFPMLFMYILH